MRYMKQDGLGRMRVHLIEKTIPVRGSAAIHLSWVSESVVGAKVGVNDRARCVTGTAD